MNTLKCRLQFVLTGYRNYKPDNTILSRMAALYNDLSRFGGPAVGWINLYLISSILTNIRIIAGRAGI